MRKVLFVTVLLAMLVVPMSTFADEPAAVTQIPDGQWVLGEIWWVPFYVENDPVWDEGDRVDAWMTRPPTAWWDPENPLDDDDGRWVPMGWPFGWGPDVGTWWWGEPASNGWVFIDPPDFKGREACEDDCVDDDLFYCPECLNGSDQRRMSYAEDWLYANRWGGYYAEFLLPRDEAWFPCSYPLKWKCDYEVAQNVWDYHSPAVVALAPFVQLDWPPFDTVSPVVIDIFNAEGPKVGYSFELEILGYWWYPEDIP